MEIEQADAGIIGVELHRWFRDGFGGGRFSGRFAGSGGCGGQKQDKSYY